MNNIRYEKKLNILLLSTVIDRAEQEIFVRMHEMGHHVVAVFDCPPERYALLTQAGIKTYTAKFGRVVDADAVKLIKKLVDDDHFDVVHILRKHAISAYFAAIPDGKAKVAAYRGVLGSLELLNPISWRTYFNPKVNRIICVSEAVRQYFLNKYVPFMNYPGNRYITIYKGHNMAWYERMPKPTDVIEKFTGKKTIGCIARMRKRKGVPFLIKAFEMLPDHIDAELLLIGEIEDSAIEDMVRKSRKNNRISLLGFRKDAAAIAGMLDVLVLPATKPEGLPRCVIEAMSQGVPAIVTKSGGSAEIVVDGESGYIVPIKDAGAIRDKLQILLENENMRKVFGEKARQRIQESFNHEQTVKKTLDMYYDILSE